MVDKKRYYSLEIEVKELTADMIRTSGDLVDPIAGSDVDTSWHSAW